MQERYQNCNEEEVELLFHLFFDYKMLIIEHRDRLASFPYDASADSLLSLCNEAIQNAKDYPFDKMNRWLGFVQGVLAAAQIITVAEERNHTRPIFHELYGRAVKTF